MVSEIAEQVFARTLPAYAISSRFASFKFRRFLDSFFEGAAAWYQG
jgi:hypothetical protein